ncbi:hypothetical protein JCM11641_000957, partial [Rhodosporidiobolus odoratus]
MSRDPSSRPPRPIDATTPYRSAEGVPAFRKILYARQPYPTNHVDASFLADLKRNANVHPAALPPLLRQTIPITQHLSSMICFIIVFVHLSLGSLSSTSLLFGSLVFAVLLRLWAGLTGEAWISGGGLRGIVPLAALYLLSPALKTLTRATTSDSIWALSGFLFALNLLLADYRSIPPPAPPSASSLGVSLSSLFRRTRASRPPKHGAMARRSPLPSTISLTAALSSSTVLASRLTSNTSVFSLLLFSLLWFGPFPLLRSSLPLRPTLFLTWALASAALVGLRGLDAPGPTVMAAVGLFGTSVAAPALRGWLAVRYKDRLSGPWDVLEFIFIFISFWLLALLPSTIPKTAIPVLDMGTVASRNDPDVDPNLDPLQQDHIIPDAVQELRHQVVGRGNGEQAAEFDATVKPVEDALKKVWSTALGRGQRHAIALDFQMALLGHTRRRLSDLERLGPEGTEWKADPRATTISVINT